MSPLNPLNSSVVTFEGRLVKKHKASVHNLALKLSQLSHPVLKLLFSFLEYTTPASKETLEPNEATDPKEILAAARVLSRRDVDAAGAPLWSEREYAKLSCELFSKIIRRMTQEEDLVAKSFYKELPELISTLDERRHAVTADRIVRSLLIKCAFLTLRTKTQVYTIEFGHIDDEWSVPPFSLTFLRDDKRLNIEATLWDAREDRYLQFSHTEGFNVTRRFYMRPTSNYDRYIQVFKTAKNISIPYDGQALRYSIDKSDESSESSVHDFANIDKAIKKLLASSKFIPFLPIAKLSERTDLPFYFVDVLKLNTVNNNVFKGRFEVECASLIYAVSQLHGLKIAAKEALHQDFIFVHSIGWIFLSNYPALALAEEDSEQNKKLFAKDILALQKLMIFRTKRCFRENSLIKDLLFAMGKEEAERPTIDAVEAHFLRLVNEGFRLDGKPPKFQSVWEIMNSPPLTLQFMPL